MSGPITKAVRQRTVCFVMLLALLALALPRTALADVTGVVRGTVTAAHHHPVAGVAVTLTSEDQRLTATTDANGRFAFPRVPFGRYVLHAITLDGPADANVSVVTGSVATIELHPATAIGRTFASSTGVAGTPVSVNTITAAQVQTLPVNSSINRVIETLPGVVRFSYDEPVVDGFHGVTYEIDGAPLPSSTSSNFANLVDPREASAIEVFTGAFPAEFGGQRMGAVVNVRSLSFEDPAPPGLIMLGGGTLGTFEAQISKQFNLGKAQISFSSDNQSTDRGLDVISKQVISAP